MALTTFHLFPQLPPELRDMIWEEAIRPDVPSAHFFTAWNGFENRMYESDFQTLANYSVAGRGRQPDMPCGLAAPRCNREQPFTPSWFDNNPSVYMEDSGLWTACWGSRRAMIRRFGNRKVSYRKETLAQRFLGQAPEYNDAPATGTMVQDGRTQYFTVCPKTDLFCLQPFHKNGNVRWPTLERDVAIFNIRGSPRAHIALEFDPHWTDDEELRDESFRLSIPPLKRYEIELFGQTRTDLGSVFLAGTNQVGSWARALWFIDYRISRDPKAEPLDYSDGTRMVFQGRGCKYVEVRPDRHDTGWIMGHKRQSASIRRFLYEFYVTLAGDRDNSWIYQKIGDAGSIDAAELFRRPVIGVLACLRD
ncbi:uncharacterized protein GGS22DRAFT_49893 [Annulohypoxylon maeteangense]|uniref:uncharacterized protein n=1 Tax=Annulohypoxylon maeteangense TaxID=1927788 RepID=UPI0020085E89|nr:uncharacterized protein GGS22DRAFT_49893 [Annulohypoxylon maeteangense]KAI0882285.1 hypothetical protein GGS22DRAFT_49893 [Annulohypoxylon maeteangense]